MAPVEEIKQAYRPTISDPVKNLIRRYDNQQAFSEYKWEYIKLWVSLAIQYPGEILKAQADQTYGYWYPDVQYWNVWTYMLDNDFGASMTPLIGGPLYDWVTNAATSYRSIPIYGMLWSIGLNMLAAFALGAICIVKKRARLLMAFLPVVARIPDTDDLHPGVCGIPIYLLPVYHAALPCQHYLPCPIAK